MDAFDILIALLTGLLGGVASGLLGIGGGAIFVPAMVLLLDEPQHGAQGASLAVIVLTATSGTIVNARHHNVDYTVFGRVMPAAVVAVLVGSYLASLLSADTLQTLFGVIVIAVALRMLFGTFRQETPEVQAQVE
jgi:uncharacterized protein